MPYAKQILLFASVYAGLLALGVIINTGLSLEPAWSLNIAATVIAALIALKFKPGNAKHPRENLVLSLAGGTCAIIALHIMPTLTDRFASPNSLELALSFLFNAVAVYATTVLYSRPNF